MKMNGKIFGIIGISILMSACGNQVQTPDPRFMPGNITNETSSNNSNLPGYMQCSQTINIRNSGGDLSKEYRACGVQGSMGSIRIYPVIQNSEPVCVFPSQGGTPIVYGNQYIAQCGSLTSAGTVLNFQGFNLNSIYVVPQSRASQFSQCLYYQNPSACANQSGFTYAFGQI
jgi:hypothetical protein